MPPQSETSACGNGLGSGQCSARGNCLAEPSCSGWYDAKVLAKLSSCWSPSTKAGGQRIHRFCGLGCSIRRFFPLQSQRACMPPSTSTSELLKELDKLVAALLTLKPLATPQETEGSWFTLSWLISHVRIEAVCHILRIMGWSSISCLQNHCIAHCMPTVSMKKGQSQCLHVAR